MTTKLVQVKQRIIELEQLADELSTLAERSLTDENVADEFAAKGQAWYRGTREFLSQNKYSGLGELEECYFSSGAGCHLATFFNAKDCSARKWEYRAFQRDLRKARALLLSLEQELLSRELPVITQLSFAVVTDEFDKAQIVFDSSMSDDALVRASGVVARVALERHLFTVADARGLTIVLNPPTKKKADVEDILTTLTKGNVITAVQRAQLTSLFAIANNCAHPQEPVRMQDVQRLITDGRTIAATIL